MFNGPLPDLVNFHKLQGLGLSNNEFSGSLEKGLCQLKHLRELDLSQNKFIGQFPQCFVNLTTQLQVLDISSNQLNGTLPSFIRRFTSIEYLIVYFRNWFYTTCHVVWFCNIF